MTQPNQHGPMPTDFDVMGGPEPAPTDSDLMGGPEPTPTDSDLMDP